MPDIYPKSIEELFPPPPMELVYRFYIRIEPKTERKRNVRAGRFVKRTDTPDRAEYKLAVQQHILATIGEREPLDGPLAVKVVFCRVKPGRPPKRGWRPTHTDPWPWYPWKRPDTTNYWKIAEDAFNGILWTDDARICLEEPQKRWWHEDALFVEVYKLLPPDDGPQRQ